MSGPSESRACLAATHEHRTSYTFSRADTQHGYVTRHVIGLALKFEYQATARIMTLGVRERKAPSFLKKSFWISSIPLASPWQAPPFQASERTVNTSSPASGMFHSTSAGTQIKVLSPSRSDHRQFMELTGQSLGSQKFR